MSEPHAGQLTPFERKVLDACLAGAHADLALLRNQLERVQVTDRSHTSAGGYAEFTVPGDMPRAANSELRIGDVDLKIAGISHGVATILYAIDGALRFIEFATYGEDWPETPELLGIGYFKEVDVGNGVMSLLPMGERDPSTLARALASPQAGEG